MNEETGEPAVPEEAYAALGNAVRLRILRALSDALRDGEGPLPFSDLRDRVGYDDDGNFGYHLQRLQGLFVRKTERGYALRARGLEVVGTILAGTFDEARHRSEPIDSDCPFCGEPLSVEAATGQVSVRCVRGHAVLSNIYPANGAGHDDPAALVRVLGRLTAQQLELAREGICANCHGRTEPRIEPGEVMGHRFRAACTRCGMQYTTPVGMAFTRHPAVVALYHRHGRRPREERLWELAVCQPGAVTERGSTPPRFELSVSVDGESLVLTLDDEATVVNVDVAES